MATLVFQSAPPPQKKLESMKALVFRGPNQIAVEEVSAPHPGPCEAVIRVTLTTICGTDLHILKGEYVRHGRLNLTPLLTHKFPLDRITEAYKLFGERREGVIKVAITP